MLEATLQHLITLVGLTDEDWQVLRESYPITQTWADALAKEFYDVLFAYPPTAQVFQPDERPKREQTLKQWYLLWCGANPRRPSGNGSGTWGCCTSPVGSSIPSC